MSTVTPAPNAATYSTRKTYVTSAEFKAAPTGVDVSQLVPGGTPAANAAALVMQLQRASAYADNYCQKVIAATVDVQAGQYRVQRDKALGAVIKVPLDNTPVIAISDIRIGRTPGSITLQPTPANLWIGRKVVTIPTAAAHGDHVFAQISYVNGWANTALTAAAAPGALSITVASSLGIMPGQQLNIQSPNNAETLTVSTAYIPSNVAINTPVPVTTPIVGTYGIGDTVTAFPQDIKQAVILITKSLIKTRGSESIVIASTTSQPDSVERLERGVTSDMDMALDLLAPYRRSA
ncbi:hypothetical protein [Pseudarthrobacter cellobiosi]|uniref:hypothetical protein n=1 Tax=Pseudarthrobacter cellobiosi TaxID=2953654 RepID=UPI00208DEEF0|nr:hypothetical protein [Pseudarthrobacter sp. HLT1-5]MCO4257408.1 hypothetical protein [Pseudarthrobacter sp. HLT1-5]